MPFRFVATLILVGASGVCAGAAAPAAPLDAVDAVLEAFRTHALVAIGDSDHNNAQLAGFWQKLIHDPRFPGTVDDIVFEAGNARYQSTVDRFVNGADVPYDELRKVWQDGWQPTELWDVPVYEDFYFAVREINAGLSPGRRLRIILGQPPLDWSAVHSRRDLDAAWNEVVRSGRGDDGIARQIEREVLDEGRHALLLFGGFHLAHNTGEDANWAGEKWLVSSLEKDSRTHVYSLWMASADLARLDAGAASWPVPSGVPLDGTALGAAPFSSYDAEYGSYSSSERDSFTRAFRLDLPMQQQFDALLYLGPAAGLSKSPPTSKLCGEAGYVKMRARRTRMAGIPDWERKFAERCSHVTPFSDIAGIWQQRGYGTILDVSAQEAVLYDTTDISCIVSERIPVADLGEWFERIERSATRLRLYQAGGVTRYTYDRLPALPERCALMGATKARDPVLSFEVMWRAFHENYAFFGLRDVDWVALEAKMRPRVSATTTDGQLFDILAGMITILHDGHVTLFAGSRRSSSGRAGELEELWMAENGVTDRRVARPRYRKAAEDLVIRDILGNEAQRGAEGLILWGWAARGVGYIDLIAMSMEPDANGHDVPRERQLALIDDAMTRALRDFSHARAIIVDARFNGGGYDAIGLRIASYFANERRAVLTKKAVNGTGFTEAESFYVEPRGRQRFPGPVYLLQSGSTKSAAEIFTIAMQALPNVTRIGTPTYGVLSDTLHKLLPNGWEVSMSNEIYQASNGKLYEGDGVPPDILVTPDAARGFATRVRQDVDVALETFTEGRK